jgi:uncharacterized alpha-E superfamily protein
MISRVAESCFWLHRYIERAESAARLLRVSRSFILDMNLPALDRWRPTIVVSGEAERFAELFPPAAVKDGEAVQQYLAWDERNPVSIVQSVERARENARVTRDVLSHDVWEALNGLHHWLTGGPGRASYDDDRDAFYQEVRRSVDLIYGLSESTMLHEEPYDFMRLGRLLERAGQTARILDVKHFTFGPRDAKTETPAETAQWIALLHSCSAAEPFFKHTSGAPTGANVAGFLLKTETFPRSIVFCLDQALHVLRRLRSNRPTTAGDRTGARLTELLEALRDQSVDAMFAEGVHQVTSRTIAAVAGVCDAVHAEFFEPTMPATFRPSGVERHGAPQ